MAKKQKPGRQKLNRWVGQQVRVGLNLHGSTSMVGILQESDRLGIYLRHSVLEGEPPVFYPWEVVFWVYPTEEQRAEEASPRPSGNPVDPESLIG